MPTLSTLSQSLLARVNQKKASAWLIELEQSKLAFNGIVPDDGRMAFQYWPETIADTKAVNYQQKEIPGGSLPLYQWVNGGERLLSFTAIFTTDVDLLANQPADPESFLSGDDNKMVDRLSASGVGSRNTDIRAAVAWLRQYMLPSYDDGNTFLGRPLTKSPKRLILLLPNSGIGLAGGDSVNVDSVKCVMTQCDVNHEQFFPNGLPRITTVSLAFAQIAQEGGQIVFPSTQGMTPHVNGDKGSRTLGYKFKVTK